MAYNTIRVDSDHAITTLTLNQPETLNALSSELIGELLAAAKDVANDDNCRCLVLTGAGRGFSSGANLREASQYLDSDDPDFGAALHTSYNPLVQCLRDMPKPVISAINGVAAGAGCNIALAGDIILAARSAQFIQAFVRIGLVPDAGGTWSIPRLIGRNRALRWMMTGEAIDAETAENWGLITRVVDDADLESETRALAAQLAAAPTQALAGIKQLVDASTQSDAAGQLAAEARMQTRVGKSRDTLEGIKAFVDKRKPQYTGQ